MILLPSFSFGRLCIELSPAMLFPAKGNTAHPALNESAGIDCEEKLQASGGLLPRRVSCAVRFRLFYRKFKNFKCQV